VYSASARFQKMIFLFNFSCHFTFTYFICFHWLNDVCGREAVYNCMIFDVCCWRWRHMADCSVSSCNTRCCQMKPSHTSTQTLSWFLLVFLVYTYVAYVAVILCNQWFREIPIALSHNYWHLLTVIRQNNQIYFRN